VVMGNITTDKTHRAVTAIAELLVLLGEQRHNGCEQFA